MLSKELINCHLVEDGQQALDLLLRDECPFRVVLMDCLMPVMDGYTAVRELRRMGKQIPVIAVTGNSLEDDVNKCREAGFSDVLVKPVAKQELLHRLAYWNNWWNTHQSTSSPPPPPPPTPPTPHSHVHAHSARGGTLGEV
eukprot:TRINITY_DN1587_c0_g2_i1.p2 TRINITY_DN1587_c0_g2~~TRINITY_DN1587_c0_g2_i1.p2  ORF type:complete len:141 (-),score=38.98 TRINITY_DN1587_c0_g2_i1:206-628(-)